MDTSRRRQHSRSRGSGASLFPPRVGASAQARGRPGQAGRLRQEAWSRDRDRSQRRWEASDAPLAPATLAGPRCARRGLGRSHATTGSSPTRALYLRVEMRVSPLTKRDRHAPSWRAWQSANEWLPNASPSRYMSARPPIGATTTRMAGVLLEGRSSPMADVPIVSDYNSPSARRLRRLNREAYRDAVVRKLERKLRIVPSASLRRALLLAPEDRWDPPGAPNGSSGPHALSSGSGGGTDARSTCLLNASIARVADPMRRNQKGRGPSGGPPHSPRPRAALRQGASQVIIEPARGGDPSRFRNPTVTRSPPAWERRNPLTRFGRRDFPQTT